jgi:hypothetical protein
VRRLTNDVFFILTMDAGADSSIIDAVAGELEQARLTSAV